MEGFSSNHFSREKNTLFVVFRDRRSVSRETRANAAAKSSSGKPSDFNVKGILGIKEYAIS
jgi:hypothetical protein